MAFSKNLNFKKGLQLKWNGYPENLSLCWLHNDNRRSRLVLIYEYTLFLDMGFVQRPLRILRPSREVPLLNLIT